MKILIIDSHKGSSTTIPQNLHWQNAKILADYLDADLIWSHPIVNDNIKSDYDIIIFVHASHYAYTDYEWIKRSPNAKLFYITNEYNLGEPRTLWMALKEGRKYDVIANHPHEPSKIVMKYVNNWHNININALVYNPKIFENFMKENPHYNHLGQNVNGDCIYYGSFRKGRAKYFGEYLDENVLLSTHSKNVEKFRDAGCTSEIVKRINWGKEGLFPYSYSLYIEDEVTHTHYNHLANRFYEALNYMCVPLFTPECRNSVELSGYDIPEEYYLYNTVSIQHKDLFCLDEWFVMAHDEKRDILEKIKEIVLT